MLDSQVLREFACQSMHDLASVSMRIRSGRYTYGMCSWRRPIASSRLPIDAMLGLVLNLNQQQVPVILGATVGRRCHGAWPDVSWRFTARHRYLLSVRI